MVVKKAAGENVGSGAGLGDGKSRNGRLFVVVGPSGAGKDTLLRAVVERHGSLHLVRRVITRPETAGGEEFEGVSEAEFARRLAAGDFIFHWRAHGLSYGIPKTELAGIANGQDVVFNGSRTMLTEAQRAFPGLTIVHVTARPDVLATRLAARGRERPAEIEARLARARIGLPAGLRNVVAVDNSGTVETGAEALHAALRARR